MTPEEAHRLAVTERERDALQGEVRALRRQLDAARTPADPGPAAPPRLLRPPARRTPRAWSGTLVVVALLVLALLAILAALPIVPMD